MGKKARDGRDGRADLKADAKRIEAQLQAIRRKLRQRLEAEFARGELTAPQRMVMEELVRVDGMSLKELSAKVSLAHSTVSGIVDRLEKQGLVEREAHATDGRVTVIRASGAVRKFMKTRMPVLALTPLLKALDSANEKERREIRKGLDTLERLLG
ncbi:MAG TPA: MarR family transcriptional regulator [Acidobacteriaceae bacterium]|nr:MarR family transcriptional regulator [Acidobacteriaceae bacterium]